MDTWTWLGKGDTAEKCLAWDFEITSVRSLSLRKRERGQMERERDGERKGEKEGQREMEGKRERAREKDYEDSNPLPLPAATGQRHKWKPGAEVDWCGCRRG